MYVLVYAERPPHIGPRRYDLRIGAGTNIGGEGDGRASAVPFSLYLVGGLPCGWSDECFDGTDPRDLLANEYLYLESAYMSISYMHVINIMPRIRL
jgi:hypothetical protein